MEKFFNFQRKFFLSAKMITDKQANNSNDYVDWVEKAVTENYIKYYEYSEFTNMKMINNGSVGNVFRASWKGTDTLLVVKSSHKLTIKEIVNEVFIIQIDLIGSNNQ